VRVKAARELLASLEDVWGFLAEPHHFPDWWPGLAAVQPDRRGTARGARWRLIRDQNPTLLSKPGTPETLVVTSADPWRRLAFQLPAERLAAEVTLEPKARRTTVTLSVEGPLLFGPRRTLARRALSRLYDLCQTAADY
jgi:uncharacterized protein YndB with AHSA1/START domain